MDITVDTSALLAVILGEPERPGILSATVSHTLIAPGCVPWEVGNAFSAMLKRRRIEVAEARRGLRVFRVVPIRFVEVDLDRALLLAGQHGLYAYDAYFLECAQRHDAPLLTLDRGLRRVAAATGIRVLEV